MYNKLKSQLLNGKYNDGFELYEYLSKKVSHDIKLCEGCIQVLDQLTEYFCDIRNAELAEICALAAMAIDEDRFFLQSLLNIKGV